MMIWIMKLKFFSQYIPEVIKLTHIPDKWFCIVFMPIVSVLNIKNGHHQ